MVRINPAKERLIGAVEWGRFRRVLVYLARHNGRVFARIRTFNKHWVKKLWYPSNRYFVVPQEYAAELGKALLAASRGEEYSPAPDWYEEFEKQYVERNSKTPDETAEPELQEAVAQ